MFEARCNSSSDYEEHDKNWFKNWLEQHVPEKLFLTENEADIASQLLVVSQAIDEHLYLRFKVR